MKWEWNTYQLENEYSAVSDVEQCLIDNDVVDAGLSCAMFLQHNLNIGWSVITVHDLDLALQINDIKTLSEINTNCKHQLHQNLQHSVLSSLKIVGVQHVEVINKWIHEYAIRGLNN